MCMYVHVCGSICQDVVVCTLVILHVYTHIHDRGGGADATVARMHLYVLVCVSMRAITYKHIQARNCSHTSTYKHILAVCVCMCLYVLVCNCSHTNTYNHIQVHSCNGGICPPSPVVYVCVYMCM